MFLPRQAIFHPLLSRQTIRVSAVLVPPSVCQPIVRGAHQAHQSFSDLFHVILLSNSNQLILILYLGAHRADQPKEGRPEHGDHRHHPRRHHLPPPAPLHRRLLQVVVFVFVFVFAITFCCRRKGQRYELVNVLSPGKCLQVPESKIGSDDLTKSKNAKCTLFFQSAGLLPAPRGWAGQSESDIPAQLFPKHVQVCTWKSALASHINLFLSRVCMRPTTWHSGRTLRLCSSLQGKVQWQGEAGVLTACQGGSSLLHTPSSWATPSCQTEPPGDTSGVVRSTLSSPSCPQQPRMSLLSSPGARKS